MISLAGRDILHSWSKFVLTLVAVGLAVAAYQKFSAQPLAPSTNAFYGTDEKPATPPASRFQCDGREHCSQMTSCDEAKFFLRNCPNTKMDGNRDGIPCEAQWCSH